MTMTTLKFKHNKAKMGGFCSILLFPSGILRELHQFIMSLMIRTVLKQLNNTKGGHYLCNFDWDRRSFLMACWWRASGMERDVCGGPPVVKSCGHEDKL